MPPLHDLITMENIGTVDSIMMDISNTPVSLLDNLQLVYNLLCR